MWKIRQILCLYYATWWENDRMGIKGSEGTDGYDRSKGIDKKGIHGSRHREGQKQGNYIGAFKMWER